MNNKSKIERIKCVELLLNRFKSDLEEDGIKPDDLISMLEDQGYFTAPASTKYHSNYEGGLADHSIMVANALLDLTHDLSLHWKRPASPVIIGLSHDLCKCDQYCRPSFGHQTEGKDIFTMDSWEYRTDTYLKGHGDKSVILLSTLMRLTEEEVFCIRYHMGAFTDKDEWSDYTRAIAKHPNVLWTHTADMMATHIYKT